MKVCHWTLGNGSGLNRVASDLCEAEKKIGLNSILIPTVGVSGEEWEKGADSDIHVIHSHIPDNIRQKTKGKLVFIPHGTPEHCFQIAIEQYSYKGYSAGNSFMLSTFWLKEADATVTFWPRHRAIWQSLTHKNNNVRCVPLGIDTGFWKPVESKGKFAGTPSVFTIENCHYIKWPLDLALTWPMVSKELMEARLHIHYLPSDQHRFWYPLFSAAGIDYTTFSGATYYGSEDLRNCFASIDYYIGLVRYGDFNRTCLEAKASGAKLISYRGNKYADFWVTEGDQRIMAEEIKAILQGKLAPRQTETVVDILDTAKEMKAIYEKIS